MKKRNIAIMICCVIVCSIALLAIFRGYYVWSDDIMKQLIHDNQEAYAHRQHNEVISKVEDVTTTLKTLAAVMEKCTSQEEISRFGSAMESIGEAEDIEAESLQYYSFSELSTTNEEDKAAFRKLKKGEAVVSNVFECTENKKTCFSIAQPVRMDGKYVGFVRGLIDAQTLLYTSQVGFFRDEAENYLIHVNGDNAFQDYMDETKTINMYETLKTICDEPEKIDELEKRMKAGSEIEVIQTTFRGMTALISCIDLPYNDWIVLNTVYSGKIDQYVSNMVSRGRNATLFIICATAVIIAFLVLAYYLNNKGQRFEQKRAMQLANFSDTVLCEYDMKKDMIKCTSNITKMLPVEKTLVENFSRYIESADTVHPKDMGVLKKLISIVPKEGEVLEYELRLRNYEHKYSWYAVNVIALYVKNKLQDRLILKITDVTESKKKEIGLVQKAETDGLTKLLNRESFRIKVEEQLTSGRGGYLFMLDLDDFKEVNDTFGHQSGDDILRMVAMCLRKSFREEDYIGRYGGDEFLVYMPDSVSEESVKKRAEILTKAVADLSSDNNGIKMSCSVGVAKCEGRMYDELLRRADEAMYKAKEMGKNSWVLR